MNTATLYLGISIYLIFLIIDFVTCWIVKHNYLKDYTPFTLTTLEVCELVFKSYIFLPIISLFMHPRNNTDIRVCLFVIIISLISLWSILVWNSNAKTYQVEEQFRKQQKLQKSKNSILIKKHV